MGRRKGSTKPKPSEGKEGIVIDDNAITATTPELGPADNDEELPEKRHTTPRRKSTRPSGPSTTTTSEEILDKIDEIEIKDEEEEGPEKYIVEKIMNMRIVESGAVEYFLKWKDYPHEANSWEPAENVECPDLVDEYNEGVKAHEEKRRKRKEKKAKLLLCERSGRISSSSSDNDEDLPGGSSGDLLASSQHGAKPQVLDESFEDDSEILQSGFSRGFTPYKIIGALQHKGELMFLMQWVGSSVSDLVRAKEANVKCPQVVIKFYEGKMFWEDDETGTFELGPSSNENSDNENEKENDENTGVDKDLNVN